MMTNPKLNNCLCGADYNALTIHNNKYVSCANCNGFITVSSVRVSEEEIIKGWNLYLTVKHKLGETTLDVSPDGVPSALQSVCEEAHAKFKKKPVDVYAKWRVKK